MIHRLSSSRQKLSWDDCRKFRWKAHETNNRQYLMSTKWSCAVVQWHWAHAFLKHIERAHAFLKHIERAHAFLKHIEQLYLSISDKFPEKYDGKQDRPFHVLEYTIQKRPFNDLKWFSKKDAQRPKLETMLRYDVENMLLKKRWRKWCIWWN